ncbi:hypothetical protein BT96DRAFT_190548 [Gymnopus androsaceus JB14]|uniref:Secreted protein n=1 Tax=Gymnopus androsaceus JB14 TaxID=1447944 RepID=A0A6A4IA07_9AGAR|nr:hypothetical protein BT96DRAFT_190548 [Gymnopus androsaceus JB14]
MEWMKRSELLLLLNVILLAQTKSWNLCPLRLIVDVDSNHILLQSTRTCKSCRCGHVMHHVNRFTVFFLRDGLYSFLTHFSSNERRRKLQLTIRHRIRARKEPSMLGSG